MTSRENSFLDTTRAALYILAVGQCEKDLLWLDKILPWRGEAYKKSHPYPRSYLQLVADGRPSSSEGNTSVYTDSIDFTWWAKKMGGLEKGECRSWRGDRKRGECDQNALCRMLQD